MPSNVIPMKNSERKKQSEGQGKQNKDKKRNREEYKDYSCERAMKRGEVND